MPVKICNICLPHSLLSGLHLFLMPNDADPRCEFYGQMCVWLHSSSWMSVPDEPSPGLFHSFYHTLTNDKSCHMFSIWEMLGLWGKGWGGGGGGSEGRGIWTAKRRAASREGSQWGLLSTESSPMCHQLTAAPWEYIRYVILFLFFPSKEQLQKWSVSPASGPRKKPEVLPEWH